MLELSYHTKYTQEETIAMDYPNNNTKHEKGKHLKYEDYVVIQVRLRDGRKANRIAKELGCAANTVRNIIRKGMTPLYNGKVLHFQAQTARYGGLENLGDKLIKSENFEMALDEVIWLITLLANQSVLIHNLKNPDDKKPLLKEDEVELLTSPFDLAEYKSAIMESTYKGTKRNIKSEENSKNTAVG